MRPDSATDADRGTDTAALHRVPARITAAWANHDADAFAAAFTEDASLILSGGDTYLTSRAEIKAFMAAAFAGPYRDTQVYGEILHAKQVTSDVGIVTTKGGVLMAGETAVAPERAIRATWVLTRQGGDWLITSYQNTHIGPA